MHPILLRIPFPEINLGPIHLGPTLTLHTYGFLLAVALAILVPTLAHLALAVLYGKVGKHDLAVTHGEKAVEIEPQDTFNWTALSTTYQRAFEGTQDRQYIYRAEDAKARSAQMQWQR